MTAHRDELRFEPVDVASVTAAADGEKLRQVLVNLIENAIDALGESPNGRRLALAVDTERDHVTLRVSDNGPGGSPRRMRGA